MPADAAPAAAAVAPEISDPIALLRHLDASGHFHRDSRLGRLYHRGMVSLRETVPENSLHVVVDGNRVGAHVDRVSPLAVRSGGPSGYSLRRALAHNLAGMAQDLAWLLRGRQGDHRCELDCEWGTGEAGSADDGAALLDPAAAAWSVQLEVRLEGRLDEVRLRAALGATLGPGRGERNPLEVVDCETDDALDAARARLQSMTVAVTASPPLHAYLARHPGGDVLMLNLNHGAADGFAALAVLECVARAYAREAHAGPPLDFLATQVLPVRPAPARLSVFERAYKTALERVRDTLDRPVRVAADEPVDEPGCRFHLAALPLERGERASVDTNVLMAALHRAIGDWNRGHGAPARRIGVLVAADLRPPRWSAHTVGNFSVMARMSTTRRDRDSAATALAAVTALRARNRRTRTGVALIGALRRAGLLALWAKQSIVVLAPLTANRRIDTTVLCNLGSLDEVPWFGPEAGAAVALSFTTPARAPLSLCIGAVTAGQRLHVTLRYPRRLFGDDAARRFAECYLAHVRSVSRAQS